MRLRPSILTTAIWLSVVTTAVACNIPVFRYALERWKPDQCEVVLFYSDALTAQQESILQAVDPEARQGQPSANVKIVRCDVNSSTDERLGLWKSLQAGSDVSLPYVLVRTKLGPGRLINGWHGPLTSVSDAGVVNSPVRRELSRRLLTGHAIVWLVIGSADKVKNQEARTMLSENFATLSRTIELPEGIGLPGSELHSDVPLLLRFSLLEVDRHDEKEDFLVKLLSGFQPDAFAAGEPLIVPVFGRGRALEVIPAEDLNNRLMEDLTGFLSGACSCQVKEQNPGFDLLLSVDWNRELFGEGVAPPPERTTRDRDKPVLLTIPPGRN